MSKTNLVNAFNCRLRDGGYKMVLFTEFDSVEALKKFFLKQGFKEPPLRIIKEYQEYQERRNNETH